MFESFLETWCNTSRYNDCKKGPLHDLEWQSRFVTWTAAYVVLGNTLEFYCSVRVCPTTSEEGCVAAVSAFRFVFWVRTSQFNSYSSTPTKSNTGTALTVSTESSVAQFMIGRCLTGIATGSMTYVAPVILHETAPNSLRKRSGLLFQLFIVLGSAATCCDIQTPRNGLAIRTQFACDSLCDHFVSLVRARESAVEDSTR